MKAMGGFNKAHHELLMAIEDYEAATGTSVNDLKGFTESYPFDKSLDELAIHSWVHDVYDNNHGVEFKVVNFQYLNTGGNCMVGIHDVWLPEERKVVYVYTNEEGSTISTVDYIRLELELDDYDEFIIDCIDWGRSTGYEKYFELYRHCLTEYNKDDCRHFGYTRHLPYHLLSDELQKQVDADYLVWCEENNDCSVETDGVKIIVSPCYEVPAVEYNDEGLQQVKDFDKWHTDVSCDTDTRESLYDKDYLLTLAGKTVRIPFNADTWDAVDNLLKRTIEEW